MSDYSKSPLDVLVANQLKGYVGLHLEQGVPILDRDLNLLHDLINATVRSVFTRYIGNGSASGADGFAIQALAVPAPQDFVIAAGAGGPGTCLVGGIEVTIPANTTYKAQAGVPALTPPTVAQPDPRTDIVYLDVSVTEIDSTIDSDLNNSTDVGMETSVRLKPVWVALVAEGIAVPATPAGHAYYPIAQFARPRGSDTISAAMITDLRQSHLTMSAIERRLASVEKLLLLPGFVPPPNEFNPKFGTPGTQVTLFGNNLSLGAVSVLFGATQATLAAPPTPSQIIVNVPAMAAVPSPGAKITVQTAGGSVTSISGFIVMQPPAPGFAASPNQFNPKFGPVGTQVTLAGTNFNIAPVSVLFGSTAGTIVGTPTASQIVVNSPAVPGSPISVPITVQTGGGSVVSVDKFAAS
jgi:IPT/TIG domain